jgi:TrmH RNA methyltransferase
VSTPRKKIPELRLCGLPAVRARWQRDPASFLRLFFDEPTGKRVGAICKVLASSRRVYRCVPVEELERIADSVHHGGIVAVVAPAPLAKPTSADVAAWAARREPVLLLDRVGNAHNLGALARTAAFLGVKHLILSSALGAAQPNDAAYRVAEGGLEALKVWSSDNLAATMRELAAAGYDVFGAATRGGDVLRPGRGKAQRKGLVALVLGNEEHGLAPDVEAACTRLVTLAGSGQVESLNVSVAGALLMWELLA